MFFVFTSGKDFQYKNKFIHSKITFVYVRCYAWDCGRRKDMKKTQSLPTQTTGSSQSSGGDKIEAM